MLHQQPTQFVPPEGATSLDHRLASLSPIWGEGFRVAGKMGC